MRTTHEDVNNYNRDYLSLTTVTCQNNIINLNMFFPLYRLVLPFSHKYFFIYLFCIKHLCYIYFFYLFIIGNGSFEWFVTNWKQL